MHPEHYLLIKNDGFSAQGAPLSARMSAVALLEAGFWPLWKRTPNKDRIKPGDRLAIYLSGVGNACVIATAKVKAVGGWDKTAAQNYPLSLDNIPSTVLHLCAVSFLDRPVEVKSRLSRLSFVKSEKWGAAFMGGTRALLPSDFKALTAEHL